MKGEKWMWEERWIFMKLNIDEKKGYEKIYEY